MNNNIFLSGATSLSIFKFYDKYFFFFGDQHYSISDGNCEEKYNIKCDIFDYGYEKSVLYETNCWTLGSLFDEWFTYNNDKNIKTDFYLETAFVKGDILGDTTTNVEIAERREEPDYKNKSPELIENSGGWIESIESFFQECFKQTKTGCKYGSNVRFHYSDVRMRNERERIYSDLYILDTYLTPIFKDIDYLNNLRVTHLEHVPDINDIISDLNNIFALCYILFDVNLLLKLCFSTDDIRIILNDIQFSKFTTRINLNFNNIINTMISHAVERNNIKMHRTAAEFNRLLKYNPYIADKLKIYITEKLYQTKLISVEELDKLYERFVNLINNNVGKQYNAILNDLNEIALELSEISTYWVPWIMDVYTLSRIFLQLNRSQEIIVLAGYVHITHQTEFMKYLGASVIMDYPTTMDNRCIISNLSTILNLKEFRNFYKSLYYEQQLLPISPGVLITPVQPIVQSSPLLTTPLLTTPYFRKSTVLPK